MRAGTTSTGARVDDVRRVLATVTDPEIPVLTIDDLGVLRDVSVDDTGRVSVTITPTYSGCPAMDTIRADIIAALHDAGYAEVDVRLVLAPAWTTDWMSADGRRKLVEYGVAPPSGRAPVRGGPVRLDLTVRCPQCGSPDTQEVSRFGSTACKSHWSCRSCLEPFDHFKAL
ncbi:MAG TPA: 1,2-phenylacetyl-CoA epoxidase subunit PaaD [Mycobacteriales bacterium]|nr:1,2-phenylacetyl-CoA epoxidase subunit PaaD [Mycobacteriales bacterium]